MKFRVQWSEQAERELAAIWLASPDRNAVSRSIDELDRRLEQDPFGVGESRQSLNLRVWIHDAIGVEFVVYEEHLLVFIYAAFAVRKN